ncbi:amidophosphoribosyltransferase [Sorangium cellulosum]|uniref:amidophosphoribosyltransferase n=1 Tax=Sorangium cellulosum TaxID=56 RepID=UPI003D9A8B68
MTSASPLAGPGPRAEGGVVGVFGHADAPARAALGLHALQHRGEAAAGVVACDGRRFDAHRGAGLVSEIFLSEATRGRLRGRAAIGQNGSAIATDGERRGGQPLLVDLDLGGLALAHSGRLTNAAALRRALAQRGALLRSATDAEVLVHLVAVARGDTLPERLAHALRQVEGAYALVALTRGALLGARDPLGVRPLSLGRLDGAYLLASESCAFELLGAERVRDVEPGELVVLDGGEPRSLRLTPGRGRRPCLLEHVRLARPDSVLDGRSVYEARKRIGRELARESHVAADVVMPVPDAGAPSALGYAAEAGVPFEPGIHRSYSVTRAAVAPAQRGRGVDVRLLYNVSCREIAGKRVVVVDDALSCERAARELVRMVRAACAREVHLRIAAPPLAHSCHYGVSTPGCEAPEARGASVEETAARLAADSLAFLSIDGLYRALGEPGRDPAAPSYCDACFTGLYPAEPALVE